MNVPRRPAIIMSVPEREGKAGAKCIIDSSATAGVSADAPSPPKPPDITVYTNSGVCPHGEALLAEMKGCAFNHVDVSQCKAPSWLPGTPTVVHNNSVYCGDTAFAFVQSFDLPKSGQPDTTPHAVETPPANPFSKHAPDNHAGCGLSKAFAPPEVVEVDESKFAESTDDAMQRLLAGRR